MRSIDRFGVTEEQLRALIRTVAKREFPAKKWIATMTVNFTEPQDYNDFPQCYNKCNVSYCTLELC